MPQNYDTPLAPLSPALLLDPAHLLVDGGRPLVEALSTHALLLFLRDQVYSPAFPGLPARLIVRQMVDGTWRGIQMLVWN